MDKPLSQERLNYDELDKFLKMVESEPRSKQGDFFLGMCYELKRLQAIEAAHNRYKRALRKVICLNVPMPDQVFNLVNNALEGVEPNEA